MSASFANTQGRPVLDGLIQCIHENRAYLSEIDGKIGDGDHGINMDKGFQLTASRLGDTQELSEGLRVLGRTLLMEIGGSMGPLYGRFFKAMAKVIQKESEITAPLFVQMLAAGYAAIRELGDAKPGDKTLVDTLDPALTAMAAAVDADASFEAALDAMVTAAEQGWQSTEDMVAKIGRSSRLGERSRGVVDAGATSCFLMLRSMQQSIAALIA